MTSNQAAKELGVTVRHARHLAARGRLPGAYRNGRDWFIPASAVRAEQARRAKEPTPA